MAKKDENIRLEIERTEERPGNPNEKENKKEERGEKTKVKNASASGLGSIGRNDQKIDKNDAGFSDY